MICIKGEIKLLRRKHIPLYGNNWEAVLVPKISAKAGPTIASIPLSISPNITVNTKIAARSYVKNPIIPPTKDNITKNIKVLLIPFFSAVIPQINAPVMFMMEYKLRQPTRNWSSFMYGR